MMAPEDEFWASLRGLTAARIGLQRAGASLATRPLLDFQYAHARARDAVRESLDETGLIAQLATLGGPVVLVSSAAQDRHAYLMRPDLGRRLAPDSEAALAELRSDYDVVFVVADGLSARAVLLHARPVLSVALAALRVEGWRIAPLVVAHRARVALGDAVAAALCAAAAAVLIGERPGLSAPDSMGAYLTWRPQAGTTDADRNCISNIRPEGIGYTAAGVKLAHLLCAMRRRRMSGVQLKDESETSLIGG